MDPPPGFTDDLVAAFSQALAHHLPDVVGAPGWSRDVDLACAAYVLAITGWLFDGALADRPRVGPEGMPSPSYRQLLALRWRWGAEHLRTATPALAALLSDAARWAEHTWGASAQGPGGYPALA